MRLMLAGVIVACWVNAILLALGAIKVDAVQQAIMGALIGLTLIVVSHWEWSR